MATSSQAPAWQFFIEPLGQTTVTSTIITTSTYCSITSDPRYQHLSFEEVRLQDYDAGRYGRKFSNYAAANLFPIKFGGTRPLPALRSKQNKTSTFGGAVLTFRVGSESSQDFVIHEGVIAPGSEFVRLALRGDWKEAKEKIIPLPEDNPVTFAIYQQWLYSGQICTHTVDLDHGALDEYELLVHSYVLGDKFIDGNFQDCVSDAIIEKLVSQGRFSLCLTDDVFDGTPPHSPLRRLWMDVYYWTGCAEWLDEETVGQPINHEFLTEFSRFQMRQRQSYLPSVILTACNYHHHEAGVHVALLRKTGTREGLCTIGRMS